MKKVAQVSISQYLNTMECYFKEYGRTLTYGRLYFLRIHGSRKEKLNTSRKVIVKYEWDINRVLSINSL